jgi:ribosomal protein S18 acetylase RimI-like enzyme
LIIRRAMPADAEAIARVHVQAWQESYRGLIPDAAFDGYTVEKRIAQWSGTLGNGAIAVHVADRAGAMCGFCSGGRTRASLATEGEVYSFYLLDIAKRQGIGRRLFTRLCADLAAQGHKSAGLWVLTDNAPARRFYEAMGGRLGESRLDRRGEFVFDDVAYIWDDVGAFALG